MQRLDPFWKVELTVTARLRPNVPSLLDCSLSEPGLFQTAERSAKLQRNFELQKTNAMNVSVSSRESPVI